MKCISLNHSIQLVLQLVCGVGALLISVEVYAQDSSRSTWTDAYISDVRNEKPATYIDLPEVPEVQPDPKPPLKDRIFDQKLTAEIKARFADKFGQTVAEQVQIYSNRYTFGISGANDPSKPQVFTNSEVISETENQDERRFGEYMVRRIVEHHVDEYTRNKDSGLKSAYQVKESLSKMQVSFHPGWKIQQRYSVSANLATVTVVNPYVDSYVQVQMNPHRLGPSEVKETTLGLGKQITKTLRTELRYKFDDGKMEWVNRRRLNADMETSISTGLSLTKGGYTRRENIVMAGWSWWGF